MQSRLQNVLFHSYFYYCNFYCNILRRCFSKCSFSRVISVSVWSRKSLSSKVNLSIDQLVLSWSAQLGKRSRQSDRSFFLFCSLRWQRERSKRHLNMPLGDYSFNYSIRFNYLFISTKSAFPTQKMLQNFKKTKKWYFARTRFWSLFQITTMPNLIDEKHPVFITLFIYLINFLFLLLLKTLPN